MFLASFGVLVFCRSLREKLRFWGKKAENSNFQEMSLAQPCWVRAHVPTTTPFTWMGSSVSILNSSACVHNSPQQPFTRVGSSSSLLSLSARTHNSHQHPDECPSSLEHTYADLETLSSSINTPLSHFFRGEAAWRAPLDAIFSIF